MSSYLSGSWSAFFGSSLAKASSAVREVSSLLMRLNMATRQSHAEVDEPWLHLLRPTVSRADYLAQLVRTYGFIAPFESACKYTPDMGQVLDVRQLARAGLIARDLLVLGLAPAQVSSIDQCGSIMPFRGVNEALGWLYVVERSTLLQDGIRRHLLSHLPDVENACAYLSTYERGVSEHWSSFGQTLDRHGSTPEAANEIIAAAHDGFECVKQWFRTTVMRRSAG